jgi:hypothetical protein
MAPAPQKSPARFVSSPGSFAIFAAIVVRDRNGQTLAYVYFEDEPGRRSAAKLLTRDEARRNTRTVPRLTTAGSHCQPPCV